MNRQNSIIPALGGHVKDFWNLACFRITHPHSWSKFRQLNAVRRRTNADCLVETGTYLGNTSMRCSRHFSKVFTIELDDQLFEKARSYLSTRGNIECIHGDATKELKPILSRDDCKNVVIFLDGHFSSGVTAHGDVPEPACELLEELSQFKEKICGIVVDDFRLFGVEKDWPTKSELLRSAEKEFDGYRLSVHLDQLVIERLA